MIEKVILWVDSSTLLDQKCQFKGSLHVTDSKSQTQALLIVISQDIGMQLTFFSGFLI